MPQDRHDIWNHQHIDLNCLFNSLFRLTSNKRKFHMDNCWWRNRPAAIGFISQQGKSEGFDSCDRPNKFTQIGVKSSILEPMWSWNLMDHPKDNMAPLLYYIVLCPSNRRFFVPCDLETWRMNLKNNRAPPRCFLQPWVNLNWSYSPETHNLGQNQRFFSLVTLEFDGWPWKTTGHLS